MRHSVRRCLSLGTTGIVVWTALMAVPPLARAGALPGYALGPPQHSASTAPVKDDMTTACQTQCQAMSTTMDALSTRVQAAQATNDPAQMRAALDAVLQQQTAMQGHMAMCRDIMGMMQSMHGGTGAPRQGQ